MFVAALFIIAKIWKQPRFPSRDEWIKKMWYIYTMEYYSATKKKRNSGKTRMNFLANPVVCVVFVLTS